MGYLRLFLALAVALDHGPWEGWHGNMAVFIFFFLSGFLIALVSSEIYIGTKGKQHFLINRFLRIYPTYWACLLVVLGCVWFTNDTLQHYAPRVYLPHSWKEWWPNLLIFGIARFDTLPMHLALVQPAWALSIELVYYLLIGLFLGPHRRALLLVFSSSAAATLMILLLTPGSHYFPLYISIQGPAIIFLGGALLYHYREYLRPYCRQNPWLVLAGFNLLLYAPTLCQLDDRFPQSMMPWIYLCMPLVGYGVLCLFVSGQEKKRHAAEQFCEDIAYPFYLLHSTVTAALHWFWRGPWDSPWLEFLAVLTISAIFSTLLVFAIERPLKPLRQRLRPLSG